MRYHRDLVAFSLLLSSLPVAMAASPTHAVNDKLLTNEGLVVLAQAGYNERFLAELVQSQPHKFDTSVEGLVYLARQGVSERMVRLILAQQRAADARESERAAAEAAAEQSEAIAPAAMNERPGPMIPPGRVRMKVVKQRMLVPENRAAAVGPNPVIVVEKRMLGDRYYALPNAQAPLASTLAATPRTQAPMRGAPLAATTQVAAFR